MRIPSTIIWKCGYTLVKMSMLKEKENCHWEKNLKKNTFQTFPRTLKNRILDHFQVSDISLKMNSDCTMQCSELFCIFVNGNFLETWVKVVYMSSSFGLLAPESRDLSQAEKDCLLSWANSQNDNYFHSKWPLVVVLSEFTQLSKQLFISQLEINHVTQEPTIKN